MYVSSVDIVSVYLNFLEFSECFQPYCVLLNNEPLKHKEQSSFGGNSLLNGRRQQKHLPFHPVFNGQFLTEDFQCFSDTCMCSFVRSFMWCFAYMRATVKSVFRKFHLIKTGMKMMCLSGMSYGAPLTSALHPTNPPPAEVPLNTVPAHSPLKYR